MLVLPDQKIQKIPSILGKPLMEVEDSTGKEAALLMEEINVEIDIWDDATHHKSWLTR